MLDGQYNILNTRENTSEICESDEAYKNGTILAQCGLCGKYLLIARQYFQM